MVDGKVLGVYAAVGTLPPAEQAEWYRKAAQEWGIGDFEIPLFAGRSLPTPVAEVLAALHAGLIVTLVAQWATAGQQDSAYGLSSPRETARQSALLDACAILQQCVALSQQGARIRCVVVHTGRRCGSTIPHAIAFYRSLTDLRQRVAAVLPKTMLAVEVTDSLPAEHPIPFPAAKKASLPLPDVIETLATVNHADAALPAISLMVNWGRLMVNGDRPLDGIHQILASEVPLAGVILSGAGNSEHGWMDSHNSHLDPESGFTPADALACAAALKSNAQPTFVGMKCSRARGSAQLPVEAVLTAQAELLNRIV